MLDRWNWAEGEETSVPEDLAWEDDEGEDVWEGSLDWGEDEDDEEGLDEEWDDDDEDEDEDEDDEVWAEWEEEFDEEEEDSASHRRSSRHEWN